MTTELHGAADTRAAGPSDDELFEQVMAPYASKGTIYLTAPPRVVVRDGRLIATGDFSIAEPCYIDDTGHFNAAEFIICYNQLMYYALAAAVRDRLTPDFAHWTLDDYWRRQLPDVLIAHTEIKFSRPVESASFTGEFVINASTERINARRILMLDTSIGFTDRGAGRCAGDIRLAIIEPPAPR